MAKQPRRGVIYTVAPGEEGRERDLGGHGRRPHPPHRGRREDVGRTSRRPASRPGARCRCSTPRRFDDLTAYAADQPHPPRRPQAARPPHARRREDLEGDREGPARRPRQRRPRGSRPERASSTRRTERMVHVSFDDGENWQPLRLNMPATSIRDLVVHGDDLVVGTHGRSVLDPRRRDAAPAARREDGRRGAPFLYAPQTAIRVRRSRWHGHAAPARGARRPEPARRRDPRLRPRVEAGGARDARDPGREGRARPPVRERRRARAARRAARRRAVLGAARAHPSGDARHAPLRVGPALPAPAFDEARVPDLRDPGRHAARAARPVRPAGHLHREAHRGRAGAHAAP